MALSGITTLNQRAAPTGQAVTGLMAPLGLQTVTEAAGVAQAAAAAEQAEPPADRLPLPQAEAAEITLLETVHQAPEAPGLPMAALAWPAQAAAVVQMLTQVVRLPAAEVMEPQTLQAAAVVAARVTKTVAPAAYTVRAAVAQTEAAAGLAQARPAKAFYL